MSFRSRFGASVLAVVLSHVASAVAGYALERGAISFRPVAIPDDVPAHLASALAQDADGFVWIGTQGGLVRYDGQRFRVFREDPADASTIGGSYVRALLAARDGRLWIGTFSGGLSVYDPATQTFGRFRHEPARAESLANDRVEGIAEDVEGRIWIATDGGLDRLDPANVAAGFVHFRHDAGDPANLASDSVRGLLVDREGRLWIGTRDGLQRGLGAGRGFERVASEPGAPGSLAGQLVNELFEDRAGRIWVGTAESGAAVVDGASGRMLKRLPPRPLAADGLSHFWVYGFAESGDEIWVATFGGGVDVVDATNLEIVERLRADRTRGDRPGSDRIGSILADRSGTIWVGTWGEGIALHDPSTRAFRTFRHGAGDLESLSHASAVRALEIDDGTIWVGTNGNGVDVLDEAGRRIGGFRANAGDSGALADGAVTCLGQGPDGRRWVATLDGTLHWQARDGGRFHRLGAADGLPRGPIRTMAFDADGALWTGAAEGMAHVHVEPTAIVAFRHDPDRAGSLSGNAVEAIAPTGDGRLWVGTDTGLDRFDPATGEAVAILRDPARSDSLPDNWVPDLLVDRSGRLWIAGQAGAFTLESFEAGIARFASVFQRAGLPPAPVESLIEDREGRVWLGPRWRVDPATWRIDEYGAADGRAFHNYFFASRAMRRNGELLFGSPEGLLAVRPDRLAEWTFEPPVVFTSLSVDGRDVPGASRLAGVDVPPSARGFRLAFAALDYTAPERLRYRVRLRGFDERWTTADAAQAFAAWAGLSPGDYTVEVEGTNRAGRWSSRRATLPVRVLPALHQTFWFRGLALVALAALAWVLFRLRLRQLERRGRELEVQVAERTSELAATNRELTLAYERIEEASLTDPLTGLRNRRYLEQVVPVDLELAARRAASGARGEGSLVLLLVDLDHFKSVNDEHGHLAGDAVLVQTAEILRSVFRASDHVVRWGGEEFLVVVRFVDRDETAAIAEKLRAAIAAHPFRLPDGSELRRTGSIGAAPWPFVATAPRATDWEATVAVCDRALYAAKRSGRDGWVAVAGLAPDAAAHLRADPEAAEAAGALGVRSSFAKLRWD